MTAISVEDISQNLPAILDRIAKGEEGRLLKESKVVARVVPPLTKEEWLARRDISRAAIELKGEPMSQTVIRLREEARY